MSELVRAWSRVDRTSIAVTGWIREAALCLTAMLTTCALLVPVLRLWRADLRVPFLYRGDALLNQSIVKSILDFGWYGTNARLGAPFSQQLYDYPVANGNNLHAVLIAGLGLFSSDSALVMNLYFLLSFPLAAMTMYLVLRALSLSPLAAIGSAVLFALAPYHFLRGEGQFFLAAYYVVPISGYLVLSVLMGRPLFARRDGHPALRYRTRRTLGTLALCLLVASASTYYAAFAVVLLVASGLVVGVARRDPRSFGAALLLATVIGAVVAANLAPSIAYRGSHGGNRAVGTRGARETELLALKVADLVLPIEDHRLAPLARVSHRYRTTTPLPGEPAGPLGIVGTIGFVALVVGFLAAALRSERRNGRLFVYAGAALILSILIATTGGLATLISYLVTPQIRAWNRIAILVEFFSLVGVAVLLDRLRARLRPRTAVFGATVAAVVIVGVLDQTSNATVPPYSTLSTAYRSDAGFMRMIEQTLPAGSSVFQLPYLSFPEADTSRYGGRLDASMGDYDQLRGYLHSTSLRWSYGGMRGRPADWAYNLQGLSARTTVDVAAADGFRGLLVDRAGYRNLGQGIEADLRAILGNKPWVSADGTLAFFDLRPYQAALTARFTVLQLQAIRRATMFPQRMELQDGFWPLEAIDGVSWNWSKSACVSLKLVNPSSALREVLLTAALASGTSKPGPVRVTTPDGRTITLDAERRGTPLSVRLVLQPGVNSIRFDASAVPPVHPEFPDTRSSLYLRLERLRVRETTFARALGADPRLARLVLVRSEDDFIPASARH